MDRPPSQPIRYSAAIEIARICQNAICALVEAFDLNAVQDPDLRPLPGAREKDRFEVNLVDTMGWLRRRPVSIRPVRRAVPVGSGRNRNPRQLAADDGRAMGAIIGEVGGQTAVP